MYIELLTSQTEHSFKYNTSFVTFISRATENVPLLCWRLRKTKRIHHLHDTIQKKLQNYRYHGTALPLLLLMNLKNNDQWCIDRRRKSKLLTSQLWWTEMICWHDILVNLITFLKWKFRKSSMNLKNIKNNVRFTIRNGIFFLHGYFTYML